MALATTLRPDHVSRLLLAAQSGRNPRRDSALIRFAAETGARPSELAALTWRALLDAGGTLTGRAVWQTCKRGAVRDVALSEPLQRALAALYSTGRRRPFDSPVFLSNRRGAFKPQSMRAHLKALAAKAGLDASGYSLRHLAFDAEARDVLAAGGTGATLLGFTGHKSLSSVQHYLDRNSAVAAEVEASRHQRATRW